MAHAVFVSYSSRDSEAAYAVVRALEEAGVRCWIAPRDIKAGDVWAQAIVQAIAGSKVLVVIFSANANRSEHVLTEVDAAVRKGAHVVPVRIENVMPEGALEYHLRTRHWLDALSGQRSEHFQTLVAAVRGLLGQPGLPPATELGVAPKPAGDSGARRVVKTTDTSYHLTLPRPGRRWSPRARWVAVGGLALALGAGGILLRRAETLSGVTFEVRQATEGSDWRLRVTTRSIRLFEGDRTPPPLNQRTYGTRFSAPQTRYLYTEVLLDFEAPGRVVTVPIVCTIFDGNGGVKGSLSLENQIAADAKSWVNATGWGSAQPGTWKPGRYRVDCRYGEKLVARTRFEMLA